MRKWASVEWLKSYQLVICFCGAFFAVARSLSLSFLLSWIDQSVWHLRRRQRITRDGRFVILASVLTFQKSFGERKSLTHNISGTSRFYTKIGQTEGCSWLLHCLAQRARTYLLLVSHWAVQGTACHEKSFRRFAQTLCCQKWSPGSKQKAVVSALGIAKSSPLENIL